MLDILEVDEPLEVERVGERALGERVPSRGVVRDDLEIGDGLFVVVVSEGGCSLLEVFLDLLLGESRAMVSSFAVARCRRVPFRVPFFGVDGEIGRRKRDWAKGEGFEVNFS